MVRNKQLLDYLLWMFQIFFFFFTTYCSARYSVNNRIQRLHNKYFILGNSTFRKKKKKKNVECYTLFSFDGMSFWLRRKYLFYSEDLFSHFKREIFHIFFNFLPCALVSLPFNINWILCLFGTTSTAIFPFQHWSHIFVVHNCSYTHN